MMSGEQLTIDELAQTVGMTTRNIRAHQTRGLLPPPDLDGRTGRYGRRHVERLQLIQRLQDEGLNLQAIALILADDAEHELARVRRAVLEPWATEEAIRERVADVTRRLGGQVTVDVLDRAVALGIIEPVDAEIVSVRLPSIIRAGEHMLALGVPLDAQIDAVEEADARVRDVAAAFTQLAREHIATRLANEAATDTDALRELVERLRNVAADVLLTLFHRAMTEESERLADEVLGNT